MAEHVSNLGETDLEGRQGESGVRLWVLLDGNRLVIAGIAALVVFLALAVLSAFAPFPLAREGDPIDTAFQAFIGAVITGVTLVLTLSQLALSQELGPIGNQRERMDASIQLQRDVEDLAGTIADPEPSTYLRLLCVASRERADALEDEIADTDDETLRDRISQLNDVIVDTSTTIENRLSEANFGQFEVIRAALNFNYSWKIYMIRRLRREHEEGIDEETAQTLEELLDALTLFGPAREYFKTQYVQWELANLSRVIIYAAIPALVVSIATMYYIDPLSVSGTTLGIGNIAWIVSASSTIATIPFLILTAYLLRIVTITQRSGATGPFVFRDGERLDVFEW
jgi:hypothetical protein